MNLFNELLSMKTTGNEYKDGIIVGLLLQKSTTKELKQCLKMFEYRGYSKLKKDELIVAVLEQVEKWYKEIDKQCYEEDVDYINNRDEKIWKEEVKNRQERINKSYKTGYDATELNEYAEEVIKLINKVHPEYLEDKRLISDRIEDIYFEISFDIFCGKFKDEVLDDAKKLSECIKKGYTIESLIKYFETLGEDYDDARYGLIDFIEKIKDLAVEREKERKMIKDKSKDEDGFKLF